MTIYEKDWAKEQHDEEANVSSPRVCLVMPRFYPLFGGHIVQMMQFLPRLQQQGISAFVVTGMIEGDPQTKNMRDLLQGLGSGNSSSIGRIDKISQVVKGIFQSFGQTIKYVQDNPTCFKQQSVTVDGIDIYRLPTFGPIHSIRARFFALSAVWYLIRNRQNYDIIHLVTTSWITPFSILLAKLLGKKTVIEMVLLGSDDPETIAQRRFGKINFAIWKRADRIASLSPALTETCERMNVAPRKVVVIPVGVDIARFVPLNGETAVSQLKEKLELRQKAKIVVFVGGVMKRKGFDLLIDAWSIVIKKEPDAHLVCIGPVANSVRSRTFYEEQKQKIDELNLEKTITITGRINNVDEYFQAGNVFVLPSIKEGLPNSVLEAMACELPPVMSDIPGITRSIIRSAEEGTVLSEREPEVLALALLNYLQNDSRRHVVGHNARQRIIDSYSLTSRVKQYDTLYRTLLVDEGTE